MILGPAVLADPPGFVLVPHPRRDAGAPQRRAHRPVLSGPIRVSAAARERALQVLIACSLAESEGRGVQRAARWLACFREAERTGVPLERCHPLQFLDPQ